MTTLKGKFQRTYRSKNKGIPVFVYDVTGKKDSIEQYEELQADKLRHNEETGNPLWFSTKFVGNNCDLVITTNDKVVADMSEYEKASSLASQFGGNFGQELAKLQAQKLMSSFGGSSASSNVVKDVKEEIVIDENIEETINETIDESELSRM